MSESNRTARFDGLLESLSSPLPAIHLFGVGAVGRNVALSLAASSLFPALHIYDNDIVSDTNTGSQGYPPSAVGSFKVDITAAACRDLNPSLPVTTHLGRVPSSIPSALSPGDIAILCVDSIEARRAIASSLLSTPRLIVDTRVAPFVVDIYTSPTPTAYLSTLTYTDEEANPLPCNFTALLHTSVIAANLAINAVLQSLRGLPTPSRTSLDLTNFHWDARYTQRLSDDTAHPANPS